MDKSNQPFTLRPQDHLPFSLINLLSSAGHGHTIEGAPYNAIGDFLPSVNRYPDSLQLLAVNRLTITGAMNPQWTNRKVLAPDFLDGDVVLALVHTTMSDEPNFHTCPELPLV